MVRLADHRARPRADRGRREAPRGERFDLAFSSDLQRTRTTAEGILAALEPQPPIEYTEVLREWHFGSHEERPARDVWQEVIVEHGFEVDRELTALRAIGEQVGWRGLFDTIARLDTSGQAEQAAATVMRADAALERIIRGRRRCPATIGSRCSSSRTAASSRRCCGSSCLSSRPTSSCRTAR